MADSALLDGLNARQREAVEYRGGPLKIVAGAGTGKTGTLTARFAYLVECGTPADRILALTFSRRAAGEFRQRALGLLDASYKKLWISTFHGFCLRVLREEREIFGTFRVIGAPEQRRLVARTVRDDPQAAARTYYIGDSGAARLVDDAVTLIGRTKQEAISPADFAEYADRRDVERLRELANVYLYYQELCLKSGTLDYGDLGLRLVKAFEEDETLPARWRARFDQVMVDEFQDVDESQWRLLTSLAPPPDGRLTVVGDGAQAIYAFRGASSEFFTRFSDEYRDAVSIELTTNYRSRQRILDVAHALIGCNDAGHAHLECRDGRVGEPVCMAGFADEDAEADFIARSILRLTTEDGLAANDIAVLCRSVHQSARALARAFTAYGIPFQVRGHDPEIQEALDDLQAVLRCIDGLATWSDAARVLVRRQIALLRRMDSMPEDALARRYAQDIGPNEGILRAVPPLSAVDYGRVMDRLDGAESWRPLAEIREMLRPEAGRGEGELTVVREALDRLEAACEWMRGKSLQVQVYAAMALVGRLDTAGSDRSGPSACRRALKAAHGLARAGLGIPQLLGELSRLHEDESVLGEAGAGTGVPVLTLHASKGLEWKAVFMCGVAAGILPAPLRLDRAFDLYDLARYVRSGRSGRADATSRESDSDPRTVAEVAVRYQEEPERMRAARFLQEERRLGYVGCTRAQERLFVTHARSYGRRETEPSLFMAEMQSAPRETWTVDADSDVMLPLDVARAARQQALTALGISSRPAPASEAAPTGVIGAVLAAQWAAARVTGGVPIRFRELPAPFVDESVLAVSFTGVDAYRTCPRQFFYGHVLRVEDRERGASATLGGKVHSALLTLNHRWMETGRPPADDEVQDAWRQTWPIDSATIEAAVEDPQTRMRWEPGFVFARQVVQAWRRGGGYLRRYYAWERERWAEGERRPVALEHSFEFELDGHRINGRIDCVLRSSAGDLVIDYKSGKASSSEMKAKTSLQLAIYERAWMLEGAQATRVAYYFLASDADKGGRVQAEWSAGKQDSVATYSDDDRQELWGQIGAALHSITQNQFDATPVKGKTTCQGCAYHLWCEESLA